MSEAYTSQPQNMGLPAIHSSQFDLRHDVMPLPSLPSLASSMNKRKRSPSLSKNPTPSKVSKKSSTPNIKSNNEDAASSDSDKKRNKLGYHRTSVACGMSRALSLGSFSMLTFLRPLPSSQNPLHDARR